MSTPCARKITCPCDGKINITPCEGKITPCAGKITPCAVRLHVNVTVR